MELKSLYCMKCIVIKDALNIENFIDICVMLANIHYISIIMDTYMLVRHIMI